MLVTKTNLVVSSKRRPVILRRIFLCFRAVSEARRRVRSGRQSEREERLRLRLPDNDAQQTDHLSGAEKTRSWTLIGGDALATPTQTKWTRPVISWLAGHPDSQGSALSAGMCRHVQGEQSRSWREGGGFNPRPYEGQISDSVLYSFWCD